MRGRTRSAFLAVAVFGVVSLGSAAWSSTSGTFAGRNGVIAVLSDTNAGATVSIIGANGSSVHQISCPQTVRPCLFREIAWSPHGKKIAFVRAKESATTAQLSNASVYVADARGRHLRRLTACGGCGIGWGSHLRWSPNGSRIAFVRGAGSSGSSIWIVNVATRKVQRLTSCGSGRCFDIGPAWSPSGREIAFTRSDALFTVDVASSKLTKVASVPPYIADPEWSPDASKIAFDGADAIYVVGADGSNLKRLLAGTAGSGPGVPSWSPDGTQLVYFNTPGSPGAFTAEVWTMMADGTAKQRLYHSACCVGSWAPPAWSPDGKQLAFSADSAGGTFVMSATGSNRNRIADTTDEIAWQALR